MSANCPFYKSLSQKKTKKETFSRYCKYQGHRKCLREIENGENSNSAIITRILPLPDVSAHIFRVTRMQVYVNAYKVMVDIEKKSGARTLTARLIWKDRTL